MRPGNSDSTAPETFRARGTVDGYATAQTSGRRELMLSDERKSVRPGGSIRLAMAGGPVVGFVRTLIDSRLNADPEFAARQKLPHARGWLGQRTVEIRRLAWGARTEWGPPNPTGDARDYAYCTITSTADRQ